MQRNIINVELNHNKHAARILITKIVNVKILDPVNITNIIINSILNYNTISLQYYKINDHHHQLTNAKLKITTEKEYSICNNQ